MKDNQATSRDADFAAAFGHLDRVRDLFAHGVYCSSEGANALAARGLLQLVHELRAVGVHCTSRGADDAAENGHVAVIEDLRHHGIHCTSEGADLAAESGELGVVQLLREQGVHCTPAGADSAAGRGHLHVVQDLAAHGILGTSAGADKAANYGHLEVVRDLQSHSVYCSSKGADGLAERGQLQLIQDLRAVGVHCTSRGADNAALNGHLGIVQDLRAHGIHCTQIGADALAASGQLQFIQELRAVEVHCTSRGADGAAKNGHFDVVCDLHAHGIHCTQHGRYTVLLSKNREQAKHARQLAHLAIKPQFLAQRAADGTAAQPDSVPRLRVAMDVDGTLLSQVCCGRDGTCFQERVAQAGLDHRLIPNRTHEYDLLRPNAREFLRALASFADIVLYTNRSQPYADAARELIDPDHSIVKAVFSREHAQDFTNDCVEKDLYFVAPSLERVVLVDDEWYRGGRLQLTNCLPVKYWNAYRLTNDFNDSYLQILQDDELMQVTLPMLKTLATVPDVRSVLAAHIASQERGLSNAQDALDGLNAEWAHEAVAERTKMLKKFGCELSEERIQEIVECTVEYAFYCINMIEECAERKRQAEQAATVTEETPCKKSRK